MPRRTDTLTEEQIARRRKIERTSQRNSRAKTKARIQELEQVIQSLQSAGDDGRFEHTVSLLMQQQEHGRQMQNLLQEVHRLLDESKRLFLNSEQETISKEDEHSSPDVPAILPQDEMSPRPTSDLDALPPSNLGQCVLDSSAGIAACPKSVPVWKSVDIALERAVQHLSQQPSPPQIMEVDIAIRAVVDGWSNVKAMHSLDLGWLTLKECDQTLFCDCSPPTRLVILRAMRLYMLKRAGHDNQDFILPPYYCHSPAQQMLHHTLLVDFFPWPNLRDFLILSPSIYQSEVFPSVFSRAVHFMWPLSMSDAYTTDRSSGWYVFSPAFEAQLQDINRWTLSSDFFAHYPQLMGHVPLCEAMHRSVSPQAVSHDQAEAGHGPAVFDEGQGVADVAPESWSFDQGGLPFGLSVIRTAV